VAKIKNVSGEARNDAWTGRWVIEGATIEIRDEWVLNYCQSDTLWSPADKATKDLYAAALAAQEEALKPKGETDDNTTPTEG
jgi:hypothetical protein